LNGEREVGLASPQVPASEAGFKMGVKTTFDVIDVVKQLVLEALDAPVEGIETRAPHSGPCPPDGSSGEPPA
jgi:hypothetical protein